MRRDSLATKRAQLLQQILPEPCASFDQLQAVKLFDLRQRHRAANRMTEERARVNRLTARVRPGGIHHVRAPDAGRKREPSGQCLPEANQVGNNAAVFARKPFACSAEASVNLVKDQQRVVLVG